MAKVIRKGVGVADLPPSMAAKPNAAPEQLVRVTLDARQRRGVDALLDLAKQASEEARRRGLTGKKLAELLAAR